uniref:Ycf1 n=3 Tax=Echinochloa TaxID=45618 RepID=A0A1L4AI56_9POAL|nr:Ycf1 [Echinochloa frumentacea]YP_009242927.1 Ycf1 [Echinochloa frumentacea]YP_009332400.1 Ycf1 [Echinochloa colona]YP_009332414.1 Ycf1 [Echinochloa colona]AHL29595.1 hypothetical chloroplast RF19 [Echinochloa crus-galli var. crus-galli]AHL29609.1 hypothetical chloroplast RF19 [Echinochloa crus-galli var. crus-galli]AMQ99165.1 Ycf1 [Echinochloa frumentacea]AMQ99179.1 Ycf1 [Echinochloa frumentacea]API68088.1 Ycf1 [Echinochloa colona]
MVVNREKDSSDFLVPENILSLQDLAFMNRYWFDTSNGSRFSMLRIQMYPQFI